MKTLSLMVLFAICCVAATGVSARLPPSATAPAEKVRRAQLVLVVEALGRDRSAPPLWPGQKVERLRIVKAIKGEPSATDLLFVTSGISGETSARCCDAGKRYLVFLNRGYPVIEEQPNGFAVVLKDADRYVSGADNAFSAYMLCDGKVLGWPAGGDMSSDMDDVVTEIQRYVTTAKGRERQRSE